MTKFIKCFIIKISRKGIGLSFAMILKTLDYNQDAAMASLKRILEEDAVSRIGAAGLLDSDMLNSLGMVAMTARSEIPQSHRLIADSYMLQKKIYGSSVVKGKMHDDELALLMKYDFDKLENTTIRQVNEELAFLQRAAVSMDRHLRADSEKILKIRMKELKSLEAKKFAPVINSIFNGYMGIEEYFKLISSYSKPTKPGIYR